MASIEALEVIEGPEAGPIAGIVEAVSRRNQRRSHTNPNNKVQLPRQGNRPKRYLQNYNNDDGFNDDHRPRRPRRAALFAALRRRHAPTMPRPGHNAI